MITRIFNLILASGFMLMTVGALLDEGGTFVWTEALFALFIACWFAGAIGLFFRSRIAWCGSMLGVGAVLAGSIVLIYASFQSTSRGSDRISGDYMLLGGLLGLVPSLLVLVGLIRLRKIWLSPQI